jgi:hypothetical protein
MDLTNNLTNNIKKNISKIKSVKTAKPQKSAEVNHKKLKLLITVVNRTKTEFYMDLLQNYEVNFQTSVLAQGTAKSETLSLLGLEDSDKSVIFSVLREDNAVDALHALEDKFHTVRNGKGIAFTVPMSSVIGVAIYRFLSNHKS